MSDKMKKDFWFADWSFPIFCAILSSAIFAGTHMYVVHDVGAFNDASIVAFLKEGLIDSQALGAAAAFGASFLFARVLEGSLVGILDIGGSLQTGVGIGIPALLLMAGFNIVVENFILALIFGAVIGAVIGLVIILIKKATVGQANSTYGADVMMGAGNTTGRYFGPLVILSACAASLPIGIGSLIGAAIFYVIKKPIVGGAILGAMLMGVFFPLPIA